MFIHLRSGITRGRVASSVAADQLAAVPRDFTHLAVRLDSGGDVPAPLAVERVAGGAVQQVYALHGLGTQVVAGLGGAQEGAAGGEGCVSV